MRSLPAFVDLGTDLWRESAEAVGRRSDAADRAELMADVDVGQTPSEVVYRENKLELLRYEPLVEREHDVPILVVYALINRPYILDLQPDRSVVRRLLERGFEVYLVDWGEPSTLDASLTLADYVTRYIDNCVDEVRERSGVDAVSLLGYCMGGSMSAMYAALRPEKVRNLGLMAASLCFDDTGGVLERWGDEAYYSPAAVSEATGTVPADFFATGFDLMDPVDNALTKYVRLGENLDDDEFVTNFARMERWLSEGIDMAGETYRQFLEEVYQSNALCRNELELAGERVDLDNLRMPVLQILAEYDHLVPPSASRPFNEAIPSDDVETVEFATGHIGLSVSRRSHDELWPQVADWFAARSSVDGAVESPDDGSGASAGDDAGESSDGGRQASRGDDSEPVDAADLRVVDGIGEVYAERLRAAGVDSLADLVEGDPEELAAATGAPESRVRGWVEQAADRLGV